MRTREKAVIVLVVAALILGAMIFIAFLQDELEANYFRWLFAVTLKQAFSAPINYLSETLPPGSLLYGGLSLFAVAVAAYVLKMLRDGEIRALRERLMSLGAAKTQAENLLQEEVWKARTERQARNSISRDLQSSIEKIELLITELNEKEKLLKARETQLMAAKSATVELLDGAPLRGPAERLLREELKKKSDLLQARDAAIKELEQRLHARSRSWESQLREKDGLLKTREQELQALRGEVAALGDRLGESKAAKKRVEELLAEELRKKKEILEATDLAVRAEEKRLTEKIRTLERQLADKEKLLRTRDAEVAGFRRQLTEVEATRQQAEARLQQEIGRLEQDRRAKERIISDLEQRLSARLHALQTEIGEKDLLLQARDSEVKSLQSEVKSVSLRLSEMAAAKARAEEALQEDLKKEKRVREAAVTAYRQLEERFDREAKNLAAQLDERDALLRRREADLAALRQEVDDLSARLRDAGAAKEQAERYLGQELEKEKAERLRVEGAQRDLQDRYDKTLRVLRSQLAEKENFLRSRDQEISSLKAQLGSLAEQLSKVGSAKARAENLLQERLKEKEVLRESDSAVHELEEGYRAKIASLEEQLKANQEMVGNRETEIAGLKSELASLNQRMSELAAAKEQSERLFQEAVREKSQILEAKDTGVRRAEQEKAQTVRRLEQQLREKEEALRRQDAELKALKNQTAELAAAKDQADRSLREELKQKTELLDEKESAIQAIEERFNMRIHSLENELAEKREQLEARNREIKGLMGKINALSGNLADLGTSKDHQTRLLQEELREKSAALVAKDSELGALEERWNSRVSALENQLSQKQELLAAREAELDTLMATVTELTQRLSDLGAERDRTHRLLQEELREKTSLLQSKETSLAEMEEQLKGRLEFLERQVAEKQRLLEASGAELGELRAQVRELTERLNEAEAAKSSMESLLGESRHQTEPRRVPLEWSEAGAERGSGNGGDLEALLGEREQLLKARDKVINDLMAELKEKKTLLAKQEIEVRKNIERREAWKHRLSKIGIRIKTS